VIPVAGDLSVVFGDLPEPYEVKLPPLADLERREAKLKQITSALTPADMPLHFVSLLWAFELDLTVPSGALVGAIVRILVEGLDLPTRIHAPALAASVSIIWDLEKGNGDFLPPLMSLVQVGLKPGDSVHLRAKVMPFGSTTFG
jgi:hypothetical protein